MIQSLGADQSLGGLILGGIRLRIWECIGVWEGYNESLESIRLRLGECIRIFFGRGVTVRVCEGYY